MSDTTNQVPDTTPDFTTEAANKLAQLFPEVVADGKVDIEKLKTILGVDVDDARERFGLTWPGKAQAIGAAQTPTTATLMPDKENSVDWDATQNVFIEGDNLEVLKVLQKHYYGKIKMIYIDPPYNTGKDFVYHDDFRDGMSAYLEWTNQVNESGKVSSNTESDGRYHSNWLNMMYPRLKLARNLLVPDGLIFLSIDDSEVAHLKLLCNEVFGQANFVAELVWKKGGTGKNDSQFAVVEHEYILVYARRYTEARFGLDQYRQTTTQYNHSDEHGDYSLVRLDQQNLQYSASLDYDLVGPDGEIYRLSHRNPQAPNAIWRWSREKVAECMDQLVFHNGNVYTKNYKKSGVKVRSLLAGETFGVTRTGKKEAEDALGVAGVFDFPKPARLIKFLVSIATEPHSHDIILDFFAGSGTTAHAVMQLNAEDRGNRRSISVQLPEPTPAGSAAQEAGFQTIAEISRERIRRAGKKILENEVSKPDGQADSLDIGFRAYKLVDTNFAKWRADSSLSEEELADLFAGMGESADDDARPEALLTEVLLKLGFSLTEQVERVDVAGLEAFSVADGLLVAYLNEHVKPTLEQLRAMVALEPGRLVVLEDAFQGDDVLKTNLVQECRSHGVDLWTA